MGFDLAKLNAGVTTVGEIVQKGVQTFNTIAGRTFQPPAPTPAPAPNVPAVTTSSAVGPLAWIVLGAVVILLLKGR